MDTIEQEITETLSQTDVTAKKKSKRRHSLEFKRQLVKESIEGTESVSAIARRYDINANMLFLWRRLYEKGQLGIRSPEAALLPVTLTQTTSVKQQAAVANANQVRLEVSLPSGATITLAGAVCDTTIQSVIKAMMP